MEMDQTERQAAMGLLARARPGDLAGLMAGLEALPAHDWLRPPEVGGVMVRGRAGATGAAFNLGEMTVTRCALRLPCGAVGHAYVQGRDKGHATRAALVDALLQTERAEEMHSRVLGPLAGVETAARATRADRAAETRVEFFTMVRGED